MSTRVPVPPPEDETAFQHLMRSCKNSITKCFGCIQTTDEMALIQYKSRQIDSRKKTFGVAYINAVKENGSPAALKALLDEALVDIAKIQKEIDVLQAEIDRVNHVTKEKIVARPGTSTAVAAATTATGTTSTAAAAVTTTTPETAATSTTPTATTPAPAPAPETETPAVAPAPAETAAPAPAAQSAATETIKTSEEQPDMEEVNLTSTMTEETK